MSFPQTRHTLIQRLAAGGDDRDWRQFLADYWGPICRFARRGGTLSWEDAEDVAAQTFQALLHNRLLARWVTQRSAKLRTLLCTVVRNTLSNRARVEKGRARLLREHGGRLDDRGGLPLVPSLDAPTEQEDAFYAAWVEELVRQAVDAVLADLHHQGKGDCFRILYSRLCEGMSLDEVARVLAMEPGRAKSAYEHARRCLARQLEALVHDQVSRYCPEADAAAECATEWARLGQHLQVHGELEAAVRRACAADTPSSQRGAAKQATLTRLSGMFRQ
jgi:RNA polymerase sigma factor (sigma-70 family)